MTFLHPRTWLSPFEFCKCPRIKIHYQAICAKSDLEAWAWVFVFGWGKLSTGARASARLLWMMLWRQSSSSRCAKHTCLVLLVLAVESDFGAAVTVGFTCSGRLTSRGSSNIHFSSIGRAAMPRDQKSRKLCSLKGIMKFLVVCLWYISVFIEQEWNIVLAYPYGVWFMKKQARNTNDEGEQLSIQIFEITWTTTFLEQPFRTIQHSFCPYLYFDFGKEHDRVPRHTNYSYICSFCIRLALDGLSMNRETASPWSTFFAYHLWHALIVWKCLSLCEVCLCYVWNPLVIGYANLFNCPMRWNGVSLGMSYLYF